MAEIGSVEFAINSQGLTKLGRAAGELFALADGTLLEHPCFSEVDFDRANQNRFAATGGLADRVHAKVIAVDKINVGMTRRAEHGAVSSRFTAETVAGRIVLQVGFGLHDSAADNPVRRVAEEEVPEKLWGDDFGGRRIERPN